MFASVERKMDRVINLLTPRRTRLYEGPTHLDRTKVHWLKRTFSALTVPLQETLVNVSTTSTSDPHLVLEELLRVFKAKGITCEHEGYLLS